MYSDGPMALADAAADCFAWAHQISGRHCRCTQMGPSHWQMLLPITSLWPIIFVEGTANALRWAHCIGNAAANYFTWAHKISVRHCRCIRMGPLHWRMLLLITSL